MPWLVLAILVAVYAVTALLYIVVTRLATGDRIRIFKAVSPGMLPPLAIVFALLVGFLAAQVWSEADAAHSRPFAGDIAVRPTLLLQVMPEAGP